MDVAPRMYEKKVPETDARESKLADPDNRRHREKKLTPRGRKEASNQVRNSFQPRRTTTTLQRSTTNILHRGKTHKSGPTTRAS